MLRVATLRRVALLRIATLRWVALLVVALRWVALLVLRLHDDRLHVHMTAVVAAVAVTAAVAVAIIGRGRAAGAAERAAQAALEHVASVVVHGALVLGGGGLTLVVFVEISEMTFCHGEERKEQREETQSPTRYFHRIIVGEMVDFDQ